MPKAFEDCVKNGGRVRTVKPSKDTYAHICFPKSGDAVWGEVKHVRVTHVIGK